MCLPWLESPAQGAGGLQWAQVSTEDGGLGNRQPGPPPRCGLGLEDGPEHLLVSPVPR